MMSTDAVERWERLMRHFQYQDHHVPGEPVRVDWTHLEHHDDALASYPEEHPRESMAAAKQAWSAIMPGWDEDADTTPAITITGLDAYRTVPISLIRAAHVGRLIAVSGLVSLWRPVEPRVEEGVFECQRCHAIIQVTQDDHQLQEPMECTEHLTGQTERYIDEPGCGRANRPGSKGTSFKFREDLSDWDDLQILDLEETPESIGPMAQPQRIPLHLSSHLVNTLLPGSRCAVTGILRTRPRRRDYRTQTAHDTYIEAVGVTETDLRDSDTDITEEDRSEIESIIARGKYMDHITGLIAPQIYGFDELKRGYVLSLVGGQRRDQPGGTTQRGNIHIASIGDPGTAKTRLAMTASRFASRRLKANAKGSTTAGLTSAAKQDSATGAWRVEPGALPKANGGVCVVDELDKMDKGTVGAMNEAMEDGKLSVSKAGLNITLNCDTTVWAVANPKRGRWREGETIADQINIDPTHLRRYDLIFISQDLPGDRDGEVVDHIFAHMGRPDPKEADDDLIRKWIRSSSETEVTWTRKAERHVRDYIVGKRQEYQDTVPIYMSNIESVTRLSEAHAKLRQPFDDSGSVDVCDVSVATGLFDAYLAGCADDAGRIDMDSIVSLPRTVQDLHDQILGAIRAVETETGEAAYHRDLMDRLEVQGIDRDRADREITRLHRAARIVEESAGKYRLV